MKTIHLLLAALCASVSVAHAGEIQLNLNPVYNIDGVANVGDNSQTSLDVNNQGGNFVYMTQSRATAVAGAAGNGLVDSGFFAADRSRPAMQLGYGLNPNGNNVLQFAGDGSVNVALVGFYKEIHVAAMTGGGSSVLNLMLNYADGSVLSRQAGVNDWYDDFNANANNYYLADSLDRITADGSIYENANDPALFGYRFVVDASRQLQSFDFIANGTSSYGAHLNIFGATAVSEVPEPGSIALLLIGALGMAGYKRRKA